jgi:hypothetical protein
MMGLGVFLTAFGALWFGFAPFVIAAAFGPGGSWGGLLALEAVSLVLVPAGLAILVYANSLRENPAQGM